MAPQRTYSRCPYTLEPLAKVDVSDEHIFPDALGGVKDYAVRASRKVNSDLGTNIDAPLVSSPLITAMRTLYGIKSRSGMPDWVLRGETEATHREVQVTIPYQGQVDVRFRKPVEMSGDGKTGSIVIPREQRDAFLEEFIANHKKKGHQVVLGPQKNLIAEPIHADISIHLIKLKRAMLKIAFLAAYEYLGDDFLKDPLIPEWHKAILAKDDQEACKARIYGVAFDASDLVRYTLPTLQKYEHAAAVVNLQMQGPVVIISLFGTGFHTLMAIASETSDFGLQVGEGKIAICDAKGAKTRFISYTDHLVQKAQELYSQF
jgi:hypothetical protein